MSDNPTLELVTFKLKDGVSESEFTEAAIAIDSTVQGMGGFIRRELLGNEDGQLVDMVYWESLADAEHAAQAIMSEPCAQKLFGLIDETSITMLHVQRKHSYR